MKSVLDVGIPVVTFLIMTIVGLDLTRADFERVRRRPRVLVAGLLGPLVLLPPVALAVVACVPMPEEIRAGLLLLAVCPVGGISNTYNYLARAATALSMTLTAASCLLAVVTMPLLARLFEAVLGRPFGFRAPAGPLAAQVLGMLVLPVAAGMTLRARAPAFVGRHETALRRVAFGCLALLIAFILWSEWRRFVADLAVTAGAAALFVALAMASGFLVSLGAGADRRERFTLSVEFATRNTAIAAAVAITLLGDTRFAVFATTYFFTESVPISRRSSCSAGRPIRRRRRPRRNGHGGGCGGGRGRVAFSGIRTGRETPSPRAARPLPRARRRAIPVFAWRGGTGRIVVTRARIASLAAGFQRTWQRPPSAQEMKGMIDDYVREEAAVREAMATGLDRDDTIIRRRLKQKVDFLAEDRVDSSPPTEADLAAWLAAHPGSYRVEERIALRQVCLTPEKRGGLARAEDAARAVAAALEKKSSVAAPAGDSLLLPPEMPLASRSEIARVFGSDFAEAVVRIRPVTGRRPSRPSAFTPSSSRTRFPRARPRSRTCGRRWSGTSPPTGGSASWRRSSAPPREDDRHGRNAPEKK